MSYQGTTSNNEITEEDNISQAQRSVLEAQQHQYQSSNPDTVVTLKETGAMTFLSTESGGTLNHEDDVTLFVAYDGEWEYDNKEWFFENSKGSTIDVLKCITVSEITNKLYKQLDVNKEVYHIKLEVHYRTTGSPWFPVTEIQNNKDLSVFISETSKTRIPLCVSRSLAWVAQAEIDGERKKVFVAYGGIWEYDVEKKRELFKNSKSSTISVPKRITLSELKDILYKHLDVDKKSYRLKLEVDDDKYEADDDKYEFHYEIKDDTDISKFISETSETKLPLFVTRIYDEMSSDVAGERQKGTVTIFVTYDGKWEYNGKEWFFKNSRRGLMLDVPKHITLSKIIDVLNKKLRVNEKLYRLKLEVHYRTGSPCFPIIEIENDRDLLKFISETSKTKVPLCVTELRHYPDQSPRDATAKNSVLKAIVKGDWVTAKEIIKNNTEEVTWTSKLDDYGNTAFHYAVGRYKDDEVVREILMGIEEATRTSKLDDYDNKAFLFAVGRNKVVREILMGIEEATWTSKLDDYDNTSFHFAVGRYKENKVVRKILCELLVTTLNIIGWNPAHLAAFFDNTEALNMMLKFSPICLFIPNDKDLLPIHCALQGSTFRYLFMKMQSYKDEFDIVLRGNSGLMLLSQVIDRGLIDEAYDLINDYPSMATQVYDDITQLERIIRKPELFYSGMHYNLYQRFVYHLIPRRWIKLWKTTLLRAVPTHIKRLKDEKVMHNTTIELFRRICKEVDRKNTSRDIERLYSSPFCLAVENNTVEAIEELTPYFAHLYASEKDGLSIFQLTVLNRSEKVYNYLLHHDRDAKWLFWVFKDKDDNNILHFAGRLAPIHKLNVASGAALQMQRELQWFEEVKRVAGIALTRALNHNKETPMMVFRKEHKELRKDGEEWMKKTADSYTITAALIITIVFAAAITVPGGNDSAIGKPIYEAKASLIIFAISDAISLFTSTTSLLLFLSILTARYAKEDFLYKLPKRLILGLMMLFMSVTSMMVAFGATLYIMFGQEKQWILIPIGALACLPIASFVTLQFPLLVELISSTYGPGIFAN